IVDEAHATGCYGPTGAGLIEASNTRDQVFASVHTCGKALGTHGGYVIVDPEIRDFLVQCCRPFIFTTSLPDAIATATVRNVQKVQNDSKPRELLEKHAAFVTTALLEIFKGRVEFNEQARSNILPILLGSDERASAWATALLEHGLRVPAIRSPAVPDGRAILRISVRADHTKQQLTQLVDAVATLAKSEGL
ncbi:MAG: aminotransferase class I/II-fold pyridoxal phosphate-dependent enzyme, partial [Planctomycetota bacterium]|nr:aminotransferase class I/II-fold pyridoxal phosphate-dependent enzyme [Planctomycetota bacterium]